MFVIFFIVCVTFCSSLVSFGSVADSLDTSVSSLTGWRFEMGTSMFFSGETPLSFGCIGGVNVGEVLFGDGDFDLRL